MNEIVFLLCQKQPTALKYLLIKHQNSQKQNGSKCTIITFPELDLLNFIGFLRGPPVCTRVKLRFLRVYNESLTMSSQKPPKKKSKQVENKQGTLLSWVKPCTSDTARWSVARAFPPPQLRKFIFWLTQQYFIFHMKQDIKTS